MPLKCVYCPRSWPGDDMKKVLRHNAKLAGWSYYSPRPKEGPGRKDICPVCSERRRKEGGARAKESLRQGYPVIDASDKTVGDIMRGLFNEDIKPPCWIQIGRTKHLINKALRAGVIKGLMMAVEISTKETE